jgi:hypothetical protein
MNIYTCHVRAIPLYSLEGIDKYLYDVSEEARRIFNSLRSAPLHVSSFCRIKNHLPINLRHLAKAQGGFLCPTAVGVPDVLHAIHKQNLQSLDAAASSYLITDNSSTIYYSLDASYATLYSELLNEPPPPAYDLDQAESYLVFDPVVFLPTGEKATLVGIRETSASIRFKDNCCSVVRYDEIKHDRF